MGYAIVRYFDPVSDERIKKLWRGLADIGVDDYLINSENNPHFKFAMFDTLDVGLAEKELRQIAAETKAVSLHFKKYGLYPNSRPFLTIDISDNIGVLKLQQEF
jgi:2'-5' RNA ligase